MCEDLLQVAVLLTFSPKQQLQITRVFITTWKYKKFIKYMKKYLKNVTTPTFSHLFSMAAKLWKECRRNRYTADEQETEPVLTKIFDYRSK